MKEKLKSKSFWLGVAAFLVLIAQMLGLKIDAPDEIVNALLASGILIGIVVPPPVPDADGQDGDAAEKEE